MVNVLHGFFALVACTENVFGVTIISKSEWGSAAAINQTFLDNGLSYAVIHHTAGENCSNKTSCIQQMKNIQNYHRNDLGWDDIGYNFLIGGDGNIYEGRGWNVRGAHVSNWNSKSIGISFMGNYNNYTPTANQITATKALLAAAVSRGQIKSNYILYSHRQVGTTECPGNNLYNEIKQWSHWKV